MESNNHIGRIYNSKVGRYGNIFISCDKHARICMKSLSEKAPECVYEVVSETDKPCNECLIEGENE